jgi:nuclear pore complex protein Nup188
MESNTDREEMEGLLAIVWDVIQHSETSFERALVAGDAEYYRTLLKLLFLGLRVHADNTPDFKSSNRLRESSPVVPIVIELLESVVANGIRELANFIHDKPAEANPEDVALVTG